MSVFIYPFIEIKRLGYGHNSIFKGTEVLSYKGTEVLRDFVIYGWKKSYGLWVVGYALWVMRYGLRVTSRVNQFLVVLKLGIWPERMLGKLESPQIVRKERSADRNHLFHY
jgi:hypothetical protein